MPPLSTWKSGYGPRREGSAASVAAEAQGLQVVEVACAALVPGRDVVYLHSLLVRGLLSNIRRRSTLIGPLHIGAPDFDRVADRRERGMHRGAGRPIPATLASRWPEMKCAASSASDDDPHDLLPAGGSGGSS